MDLTAIIHHLLSVPEAELNFLMLRTLKINYAKTSKSDRVITNAELTKIYLSLLHSGQISKSLPLEQLLRKRSIRSQSGIVPIQVLTKPFRCPGKCIFCPNDFTMPKSYINTEPGAQRALMNGFDPIKQTYNRLLSLTLNAHTVDKIEMIVLGGTRDVYPEEYKTAFIKGLYDACNTFDQYFALYQAGQIPGDLRTTSIADLPIAIPSTIAESLLINETAGQRIIGLTIETRPEYVTDANCVYRRSMGITRIEMGIQNLFDDVLEANKRGHTIQQVREAMHRLRSYGFKMSCHFMPGLYGSTFEKDIDTFRQAFDDPFLQPDEIKFYPTSVIPNTELYELYRQGVYEPMSLSDLKSLIIQVQTDLIPPYTRIKRLIRDIPATEIIAGSNITNLRQLIDHEMQASINQDEKKRIGQYSKLYTNTTCYPTLEKRLHQLNTSV